MSHEIQNPSPANGNVPEPLTGRQRRLLTSRKLSVQRKMKGLCIYTCMCLYMNTAEINNIQQKKCYQQSQPLLISHVLCQNALPPHQSFSSTMEAMTGTSVKPYTVWGPSSACFQPQDVDLSRKFTELDVQPKEQITWMLLAIAHGCYCIILTPLPSSDTTLQLKLGPSYSMITLTASQKSSKAQAGNHRW